MSGVIMCTLSGTPDTGDEVFWYWCDARGGRSEASTKVVEGDTLEEIAKRMVDSSKWTPTLNLATNGATIICIRGSAAPAGTYPTEVLGTGSLVLTVTGG